MERNKCRCVYINICIYNIYIYIQSIYIDLLQYSVYLFFDICIYIYIDIRILVVCVYHACDMYVICMLYALCVICMLCAYIIFLYTQRG